MAEETRVYGMADQANRHPPAAQGVRGEKASTQPETRHPEFSHSVTLDSGKTVVVSEGNGVAYAEATGRIAKPEPEEMEIKFVPEERRRRSAATPLLLGAVFTGAGAALYFADQWLRRRTERTDRPQDHATGPLVPVQELPHQQQPALIDAEPIASASRTSASSDRFPRSPDI